MEKIKKSFPCGALLLYVMHEVFIEVPLFQEILSRKISGCASVNFKLTFRPKFHPNILVFANLLIYRKLIHDNIKPCVLKTKNLLFSIILKEI